MNHWRERLFATLSACCEHTHAKPVGERKIGHDLNNQLNIILGYADLLSTPSSDQDILDGLERIRTAGLKMAEIIKSHFA